MAAQRAYQNHLVNSDSLITPYAATRAGFLTLALEKNRLSDPFVTQARTLAIIAQGATQAADLLAMPNLRGGLLTAAGLSDKALPYLTKTDQDEAVRELIANFLEPAGDKFIEELVYRFLLTRGEALGGKMKNVGGQLAQTRLFRQITAQLTLALVDYEYLSSITSKWIAAEPDPKREKTSRGLAWQINGQPRTLLFNVTVPLIRKNVDLVLLNCDLQTVANALQNPQSYIALGELKGGIDPAGADEHWKTARSALGRIRTSFAVPELKPHTFFIGASIQAAMAHEIWNELVNGILENAANLTNDVQLASLCQWLCTL